MTNIEALRSLLETDEQKEFLDAIEKEIAELKDGLADCEADCEEKKCEVSDLEDRVKELEDEKDDIVFESHVIAGLDTINIYLEQDNLEIRNRVDTFLTRLKQHYNATTA